MEKDPTLVDSPISMAVDVQLLKQSGDPYSKVVAELRGDLQTISATVHEIYGKMVAEEQARMRAQWEQLLAPFQPTEELPFEPPATAREFSDIVKEWTQRRTRQQSARKKRRKKKS